MMRSDTISRLGGISLIALAAAAFSPAAARACPATLISGNDGLSVSVVCGPGDEAAPFATSYSDFYDGSGNDTVTISGGQVFTGAESTPFFVGGGLLDRTDGVIDLLGGNDLFVMQGGQVGTPDSRVHVVLGSGDDIFRMTGGRIYGSVFGLGGEDLFEVSGGTVDAIYSGSGNETVIISGTAIIGPPDAAIGFDAVGLEDGDDIFIMTGGTLLGGVSGGAGADVLRISGGRITGYVAGNEGDDLIEISGTANIEGHVTAGEGNDRVIVSGGTIGAFIDGGEGNDTIEVSGNATIAEYIFGNAGNDTIVVSGGTIGGSVAGGAGQDDVTFSGGSIGGDIEAETVRLYGGTLGGDVYGLTGSTLIIDETLSATPLVLRDGVSFSGTGAVGNINATDLAQAAGGTVRSQLFSGFSLLQANGSTLGFSASQIIDRLELSGSTLFVRGDVSLGTQGGGLGALTAAGSTIDLVNNSATDILRVGQLALDGATIAIDVDPQAALADQIIAQAFSAVGDNAVQVNLLGPAGLGGSRIPIILASDANIAGTLSAAGLPGTAGALLDFQIVQGDDGQIFLVTGPGELIPVAAVQSAVDAQALSAALNAFGGVVNDVLDTALGFSTSASGVAVSPTVGIFATGQYARVSHDGFAVSGDGFSGQGAPFSADDFSLVLNVDFNAAKHFGIDDRYGLNFGAFGGYTSSDVTFDPFGVFPDIGGGKNRAAMFGGYGLFRQGFNYALVAASGFAGETDIVNSVLDSRGSYDTFGYAVTASGGRIFPLSDQVFFDLRGGLMGASFRGSSYTDSQGTDFGRSRISFGAVKFEPGIYSQHVLENGMVFSPYGRLEVQQRFGYSNSSDIAGTTFDFDDSDLSASLSAGFNLKMTQTSTLSAEVRGKASSDSTTLAGKLGFKASF